MAKRCSQSKDAIDQRALNDHALSICSGHNKQAISALRREVDATCAILVEGITTTRCVIVQKGAVLTTCRRSTS